MYCKDFTFSDNDYKCKNLKNNKYEAIDFETTF